MKKWDCIQARAPPFIVWHKNMQQAGLAQNNPTKESNQ